MKNIRFCKSHGTSPGRAAKNPIAFFAWGAPLLFALVLFGISSLWGCTRLKSSLGKLFSPAYELSGNADDLSPSYTGKDASRTRVKIQLTEIVGAKYPTDIQFPPGSRTLMFLLEKKGKLRWYDWVRKKGGVIARLPVVHASEQGLLGLAFHPDFTKNGKLYLQYSIEKKGRDYNRIAEFVLTNRTNPGSARLTRKRVLLDVYQPYANHNAGQLAFGPDGMLYIGMGDGGWAGDPHNHGQNPRTLLGAMLRIDVNKRSGKRPYAIPLDNPFLQNRKYQPEIWAMGLRNPWRYSFTPDGRLVLADVGQNKWEEVDIVEAGKNYGWKVMEGRHCFSPARNCKPVGVMPVYEYGHDEGQSITGGYVYTGKRIPRLRDRYVFGDFVSGRVWAIRLPAKADGRAGPPLTLGKWNVLISTFGRDNQGEIYLADYGRGKIYRLDPVR